MEITKDQLINERENLIILRNKASFEQNFTMRDSYEEKIKIIEKQIKKIVIIT